LADSLLHRQLRQQWVNGQRRQTATALGELVESFRRRLGDGKDSQLHRIQQLWPDLVGADLAGQCFPNALRRGILTVLVETSAARFELELRSTGILERVKELRPRLPVNGLRFLLKVQA